MKIPFQVLRFEEELESRLEFSSLKELPDSLFQSHEDFLRAQENEEVAIWFKSSFSLMWKLCHFPEKVLFALLHNCGYLIALLCVFAAFILKDFWLFLAVPLFIACNFFATPSPGCIHGFVPTLASFVCAVVATRVDSATLLFLSLSAIFVWFAASFGAAIAAEVTFEAIRRSEVILTWLLHEERVQIVSLKKPAL